MANWQGDGRARGVTGDMGTTDTEVAEQGRRVGRVLREAHGAGLWVPAGCRAGGT